MKKRLFSLLTLLFLLLSACAAPVSQAPVETALVSAETVVLETETVAEALTEETQPYLDPYGS